MTNLTRRALFRAAAALLVAPAIVRVASLMPVKAVLGFAPTLDDPDTINWWTGLDGVNYSELAAITRRAYVPRLFAQIYETNPLLRLLIDNEREVQKVTGIPGILRGVAQ